MGYRFGLEHSNIVVYLTTPAAETPRVRRTLLQSFLFTIENSYRRPWFKGGRFISRTPETLLRLHKLGEDAISALNRIEENELAPADVSAILAPLKRFLTQYRLYALAIADERSTGLFSWRLINKLAFTEKAFVMIPDEFHHIHDKPHLDALPAWELCLRNKHLWPGLLVWTGEGDAVFIPYAEAETFVAKCLRALSNHNQEVLRRILREYATMNTRNVKRILHLSDLHFGCRDAAINAPLLQAELHDVARQVDRVVVTGDLFNNPKERDLADYQRFSQYIHQLTGREVICIPGNHDMRWLGSLRQDTSKVAALRWSQHVVDDDLQLVFFGFNSSEGGGSARGKIGTNQLARIAADHRNALAVRPHLKDYLTIALVHHHPYSFQSPPETALQRLFSWMGLDEESQLLLEDADKFTEWCARWGASLVLHGHKHVLRYETRMINPEGMAPHILPAVGCGTSLGAEGAPLSYVVVDWNSPSKRWNVSAYESRGGGPFQPKLLSVVRDNSAAIVPSSDEEARMS